MARRLVVPFLLAGSLLSASSQDDHASQYQRGVSLFEEAKYQEALRAFDTALRASEGELAVRARKGKVRAALRLAEFDLARREADMLAAAAADDAESLALQGDALWAAGLFEEADGPYGRALALRPDSSRARFGRARSLATRSRLDEALAETQAALAGASRDADLHALSATIYERLLRYGDAATAYATYADLLPAAERTGAATARARAQLLRSFSGRQPVAIEGPGSDPTYTVPFRLISNKVVVRGRLNGTAVDWVVDTGAERTGVSFGVAESARVATVTSTLTAGVGRDSLRRVRLGRAERLEIGALRIRNVPLSIRNAAISGPPAWQTETLSPIALGLSVIVDYGRRQVTFARQLPDAPGDITLPMRFYRLPLVHGTLNARHPANFIVDTGGEVISISAETAGALGMQPRRRIPLRVVGLSGRDEEAFLLPGVDLAFNELEYQKVGLAVLNLRAPSVLLGFQIGGIVGHKLLGGYSVSIDVARSEVRLNSLVVGR